MNARAATCLLACASLVAVVGCATTRPPSFSNATVTTAGWATIEIRDGVGYDRAWDTVFSILAGDFDIEKALKDDGYLQTGWLYTWSGRYQANYKVRVTAKFTSDRKKLQVRCEAWALSGRTWLVGTDTRLMSTLKTDLMGTVGRTTR
jgi:hypothetical protein